MLAAYILAAPVAPRAAGPAAPCGAAIVGFRLQICFAVGSVETPIIPPVFVVTLESAISSLGYLACPPI